MSANSGQNPLQDAVPDASSSVQDAEATELAKSDGTLAFAKSFEALVKVLHEPHHRFALAAVNDLLTQCPPSLFEEALADVSVSELSLLWANYVAAMVEVAANRKGCQEPNWVHDVAPLAHPYFATSLAGLRLHLLRT